MTAVAAIRVRLKADTTASVRDTIASVVSGFSRTIGTESFGTESFVIDSPWGFTALRPEWNALLRASGSASPFLTWEWLHTWWRHLNEPSRLRMLTVRAGADLIAVAPFRLTTGTAHLPCLEMLGTGDAGSDYLDIIVRRGWEADALDAIEQFVESQQTPLRLTHLGPSAIAEHLASRLVKRGWAQTTTAGGTCPYIPLAGRTWESYLATLGSSHRANVRRRLRALEQKFKVTFARVATEGERRDALPILMRYHGRRFDARGTTFATAPLRAFHDELTKRALDRGWLRMYVLRLDGAPAAVMYGFFYDGTFYFYQHGFDDQYQQHSIGLVLMALTIRAAIDEGAAEFDMLWGVEPYKFLWARDRRELRNIHLFPASLAGRLHRHLFHARAALAAWLRRAKPLVGSHVP
jgi:CelD/BcsL family acetyltransferase involved in cellulose biosynthesis